MEDREGDRVSRGARTYPHETVVAALRFIASHTRDHGCPPSVREIGASVGYKSSDSAHLLVDHLCRRGYMVAYAKTPRSAHLTELGRQIAGTMAVHPLHKEITALLPPAMAWWSQEVFAAGWLSGLDRELPKMVPEIREAALALGRIPVYFDGENETEWRPYPDDED